MDNFSAIDMATAAAQGFRDGVASVANSAIPNNQSASAAQSAPAGFDFTIEDRGECRVLVWSGNNGCRPASDEECAMWDALAAWQRTQSAAVPEGWRLVPVEPTPKMLVAYMEADGAVKRWKAMIAAAPSQPAAQVSKSAKTLIDYAIGKIHHINNGLCPDVIEGHDSRDPDCAVCQALVLVQAAQDQGEVQSSERWTVACGHWQDTTLAIHGERTGHIASGIDEDAAHAIVKAHNEGLPTIAAASTGQEV